MMIIIIGYFTSHSHGSQSINRSSLSHSHKIIALIRVTVKIPKPKKIIWKGSTRATLLYDIIVLGLSQPLVCCLLPGPPRLYFLGRWQNHLGWGAPKHTPLMTYLYMLVSSRFVSFFFWFTWKWDFATPSTHTHMIEGICVQAPPQVL